jgi:arsenate reductase (thioredoxin)
MSKPKVLFICLGNSCRSIMAEALTRQRCGEDWEAASAGLAPLGWVAPETLEVLAEVGVSIKDLRSKDLNEFELTEFRLLVNLSEYPLKRRLPPAVEGRMIHRPAPDPFGGGLEVYRKSRDVIDTLINRELCRGHTAHLESEADV